MGQRPTHADPTAPGPSLRAERSRSGVALSPVTKAVARSGFAGSSISCRNRTKVLGRTRPHGIQIQRAGARSSLRGCQPLRGGSAGEVDYLAGSEERRFLEWSARTRLARQSPKRLRSLQSETSRRVGLSDMGHVESKFPA